MSLIFRDLKMKGIFWGSPEYWEYLNSHKKRGSRGYFFVGNKVIFGYSPCGSQIGVDTIWTKFLRKEVNKSEEILKSRKG